MPNATPRPIAAGEPAPAQRVDEAFEAPAEAGEAPATAEAERPVQPIAPETKAAADENPAGESPPLEPVKSELEKSEPEPEPAPSLIGRYSSGGANYKIFADGSIEAETSEGTFKFASMADFKRYLLETKGNRHVGA